MNRRHIGLVVALLLLPSLAGAADTWHRFDLSPGKHTLRLVVRGEKFRDSKGSEVRVHSLIVYR